MRDDVTELLSQLVQVDTTNPPGNERAAAEVLARWLAERVDGIDVEIDAFAKGRANLLARVEGTRAGPALMLNTHFDVVPAAGEWRHPPFSGAIADGFVYGRGAADAKGSLAVMAAALVRAARRRGVWCGSLTLAAVADEEVGSAGARRLLDHVHPDGAIVGEPTGLRLMTAHKGSFRPVVRITGRAAHAAQPEGGINAAVGAGHLLVELEELAQSLKAHRHVLLGTPTLVPTLVSGGEAPNAVPARCEVTIDRRLLPGETEADAQAEIATFLERFRARHPQFEVAIAHCLPTTGGPSETALDHPFVEACLEGLARAGQTTQPGGLLVNCDMTHFRAHGVPTVVYGPGRPEVMHTKDECVAVAELEAALQGLESMIDVLLAPARRWDLAA